MTVRLPPSAPERELEELKTYLGPGYEEARLRRHAHGVDEELAALKDEQRLYRSSEAYLYDLTAFAMSRTKEPYLASLVRAIPPPARLLDFGCGIGSDGLRLLALGYEVGFADFDNPSVRYLRWRLERRGYEARIFDLDREEPPPGFDLAYAFDVIEHVQDPQAFLTRLETAAEHVLVNFLEPEPGETELHHPLPVRELIARARAQELLHYRRHHGRSHLVLYRRGSAGARARLGSETAYWRGRLASGV